MSEQKGIDLLVQSVSLEDLSEWVYTLLSTVNAFKTELHEKRHKPISCPGCYASILCSKSPELQVLRMVGEGRTDQGYALDLICPNCKTALSISASLGFVVVRLPF